MAFGGLDKGNAYRCKLLSRIALPLERCCRYTGPPKEKRHSTPILVILILCGGRLFGPADGFSRSLTSSARVRCALDG